MQQWKGKVAVVSGASAGIGLAIVRDLVKNGVITVALSRRPQLVIDETKSSFNASESGLLHSLNCDISDETSVKDTFQTIKNKFKTVHILINNAGVLMTGSIREGPVENFKKTFDVNVMGLLLLTKEAFTLMQENKVDGHVININSVAGHKVPSGGVSAGDIPFNVYPASKHAVTALTETLRLECSARGLKTKITSLSPGLVKTDIFKANGMDTEGAFVLGPHLLPQHISDGVIYVLSTPPTVNVSELTIQPVGEAF